MAALTWDDVDLEHGVIVLQQHKTSRTQRTPRPRVIQLVPDGREAAQADQTAGASRTKHVFLTSHRQPWNVDSLGSRMRRLRERAGLPNDVKLYGIRHQFGTQSVVNGVDIKTLAELMGHTPTRMTEHYCPSGRPSSTPCRRHAASSRPASRLLNRPPSAADVHRPAGRAAVAHEAM